jgi:predicted signal transduction protein with EAL and GGDEF domain
MDLDTFKDVNDSRGHHAGDEFCSPWRASPREQLRATDIVARLAGRVRGPVAARTPQSAVVAADLLDTIGTTFVASGSPRITASIGMALFPDQTASAGSAARRPCHVSRKGRRARPRLFTPDGDWQAQIESRISWQQRVAAPGERPFCVAHSRSWRSPMGGSQHELCCAG